MRQRRLRGATAPSVLAAVAILAAIGLFGVTTVAVGAKNSEHGGAAVTKETAIKTSGGPAASLSRAFRDASQKVLPSVVMITNTRTLVNTEGGSSRESPDWWPFGGLFGNREFRKYFGDTPDMPGREMPFPRQEGMGSGVIIDSSGVILTNYHVVAGRGTVVVHLHDGREFKAADIKADPKTDLAIVRIKGAHDLQAAEFADSDALQVGDWVLALGQPFGLEDTVTAGIISAKGRSLGHTARERFLQTDAAINPGNSGGPLVDLEGRIVGINTAISSNSGGFQGVGFAVPSSLAKWVSRQLMDHGEVSRAYLGVMIQPVTEQLAKRLAVKLREGVLVTEVYPDSPAQKAGVKAGDVIVAFDGRPISNPMQLQATVEQTTTGRHDRLAVVREGKRLSFDIVPAAQPAAFGAVSDESNESPAKGSVDKLGLSLQTMTRELAARLDMKYEPGVAITDVQSGSPAALAGLSEGMLITQVNRIPVASVDDFHKAFEKASLKDGVLMLLHSKEGARFVVLRMEQ